MDVTKLFSAFSADVVISLIQTAIVCNIVVYGAKLAMQAIKIGINKSPIPVTYTEDQIQEMSIFNIISGIAIAILISWQKAVVDYPIWKLAIDSLILWFAALFTWKLGVSSLVKIVPASFEALLNKLKGQ